MKEKEMETLMPENKKFKEKSNGTTFFALS